MKFVYVLTASTLILLSTRVIAQEQQSSQNHFIDITGTFGSSQGTVGASYVYNWKLGKKRRIEVGLGARWTTYFGTKTDFLTAGPAEKTRSFTTPFVIFFAGQQEENFDTLTVQRPLTNSVNLSLNLGYNLSRKWYAGFNIDLIGFSFGRKGSAVLTSNGTTVIEAEAKPVPFNILLTGDHDHGTLNSEFFLKYALTDRCCLKALYQFIFVEYETTFIEQTFPDGTTNNRFRNKANNFGLGVSYKFK